MHDASFLKGMRSFEIGAREISWLNAAVCIKKEADTFEKETYPIAG